KTTWNASDSTAAPVVLDTPIPASPEPTAQPAVVPAATFTPTLAAAPAEILPTATPTPIHQAPGAAVTLTGFDYIRQTWNNCGPATLAMHLSYFGSDLNQATIGAVLRPYQDDKNVNPVELAEYAREQGYHALVRVNGD